MKTLSNLVPAIAHSTRPSIIAAALLLAPTAHAQCPPAWIPLESVVSEDVSVSCMVTLPDGDAIVGGLFHSINGVAVNSLARYNPATGTWSAIDSGTNGSIRTLALLPGGDLLAGGHFTTAGDVAINSLARVNLTTGVWSDLGAVPNTYISDLAVLPGGDVAVAYSVETGGPSVTGRLARLDLNTRVWTSLGFALGGGINELAVLPSGNILASTTFGNGPYNPATTYFDQVNPTTGVWTRLRGTSGVPATMLVLPDGDVLVGGTIPGGIIRYNPAANTWSSVGSYLWGVDPTYNGAFALALLPDGDWIVGGRFSTAGGMPVNNIARFNPTTRVWTTMGSGTGPAVETLAVLPGGDVLVGGNFRTAGGIPANAFARYTFGSPAPSIDLQPSPASSCPNGSATFVVSAGGGPLIYQWRRDGVNINTTLNPSAATASLTLTNVGTADAAAYDCVVSNACGNTTTNAATLSVCAADYACDGFLDIFDYDAFVAAFETAGAGADFNRDGVVDGFDYDDFVLAFEEGC